MPTQSPKFEHVMLDLETLSNYSNAVIVTVAAVKFSFDSDETETFCRNVNPRESKELGLHISQDTLQWWREQDPAATKAWMHSQNSLGETLDAFDEFIGDPNLTHWAYGACFDFPIMDSSYRALNRAAPWKFYKLLCARTIISLSKVDPRKEPRVGVYHNAVDDCLTQIANLKKALGK
jgi:hypothetical protein